VGATTAVDLLLDGLLVDVHLILPVWGSLGCTAKERETTVLTLAYYIQFVKHFVILRRHQDR
jgi:hypothetical protein